MAERKDCPESLTLDALADDRLAVARRKELAAHLDKCPACRQELQQLLQLKQDLKLASRLEPEFRPGPELEEKIFSALRREPRRRLAWVLAPVAAAALLLALFFRLSPPVPAEAEATATVLRVEGHCSGLDGRRLPAGRTVATGEEGRLLVQFAEGEYLFLASHSRLSWKIQDGTLVFNLEAGRALFRFEGTEHRSFLVKTSPTEVRTLGTVFSLELLPQQTLRVEMYQGEVEVTSRRGASSRLQARQCALVTADSVQWVECERNLLSEMAAMIEDKPAHPEPPAAPPAKPTAAAQLPPRKTPPVAAAVEESLENRINAVNGLLARRQFDQADPLLNELLRRHPDDFRLRLLACDSLRLQEKLEAAVAACRQAEQLARQEHQKELARYQQGRLLLQLKRESEAEKIFLELLADFPDGLLAQESHYALLEAQLRQENYPQARITAASYLDKYPQGAGAHQVRELLEKLQEEK